MNCLQVHLGLALQNSCTTAAKGLVQLVGQAVAAGTAQVKLQLIMHANEILLHSIT